MGNSLRNKGLRGIMSGGRRGKEKERAEERQGHGKRGGGGDLRRNCMLWQVRQKMSSTTSDTVDLR